MSRKAAELLIELAQDPRKLAEFKQSPDAVMDAAGLPSEDKEVLASGDLEKIWAHFRPHQYQKDTHTHWYGPRPRPRLGPDPGERAHAVGGTGSLCILGTGYRLASDVSAAALAEMRACDKLFHLVLDSATSLWIESLNPSAESLQEAYVEGRPRDQIYEEMVETILAAVRRGLRVCVAFYGHPGVFGQPGHEAVRRARSEGHAARMLPGISVIDSLFADLGVDPAQDGCQIFDATDFLIHRRAFDADSALVLLQVGSIAVSVCRAEGDSNVDGLKVLAEVLSESHPADHQVIVYRASPFPICEPILERVTLEGLSGAGIPTLSTLFVPPAKSRPEDRVMLDRLGLSR